MSTRVAALCLVCCFGSGAASAANDVALDPALQTVAQGATASVDLTIDFDETTIGGGIVVTHGAGLSFDAFTFDAGLPDLPALRLVCPDAGNPACDDFAGPGVLIAFGSPTGLTGSHVVGTLDFDAAGSGLQSLFMTEDDPNGIAGEFEPLPPGSFAAPGFSGATIDVLDPAPTLPGPLALLFAALLLGACGHRRQRPSGSRVVRGPSRHAREGSE